MKNLPLPPTEDLRAIFAYDVLKGELVWRESPSNRVKTGSIAGNLRKGGYRMTGIDGKQYLSHRLIWKWVYGADPHGELDHIGQEGLPVKLNHSWNLQEVTSREHRTITHAHYKKSGLPIGVYLEGNRYQGRIVQDGKKIYLGTYDTPQEAHHAYLQALQAIENGDQVVSAAKPFASPYKGVSWHKKNQKWTAQIAVNGKQKYLGSFLTEEEAHQAYLSARSAI